jgi:two-component system chemotaxis response regulator CheY
MYWFCECIAMKSKNDVTFLVIDDSEQHRDVLSYMLRKEGFFKVHAAENGPKGIELFKTVKPDIVFLDIMMPGMDGIETLRELKKIDSTATIVILTALSKEETALAAKESGARLYVLKPFNKEKIVDAINKILR